MAATAPWEATIDGRVIATGATQDHMVTLNLPPSSSRLQMRYLGPPGEWASVAVSATGLLLGLALVIRTSRRRTSGEA
jgi:uncharacterized membrane protein YfhO